MIVTKQTVNGLHVLKTGFPRAGPNHAQKRSLVKEEMKGD